jgi:hypothetical protein
MASKAKSTKKTNSRPAAKRAAAPLKSIKSQADSIAEYGMLEVLGMILAIVSMLSLAVKLMFVGNLGYERQLGFIIIGVVIWFIGWTRTKTLKRKSAA